MINPSRTAVAPRPSHRRVLFFIGEVCSRLSNSQSIESSGLSQGANQAQSKVESPKPKVRHVDFDIRLLTLDSRLVLWYNARHVPGSLMDRSMVLPSRSFALAE